MGKKHPKTAPAATAEAPPVAAPSAEEADGMDSARALPPDPTAAGLRHLAAAGAVFAGLTLLTYVVPPLERLRPWLPDEPVPVLRFFLPEAETELAETAPEIAHLEELAIEEPPPPPPEATLTVAPEEYAELTTPIEDPSGALRAFHAALARTARDRAEGSGGRHLTRIAHFGDSTIALDGITMTVRERLQTRFGDGGHGFVLAARGSLPYRHHMVRHESEGSWRLLDLTHLSLSDGRYGLGGVQARAVTGAEAYFATDDDGAVGNAVSRFVVLYQRHERGGQFRYRVDEGAWTEVDTHGEDAEDAALEIDVEDGPHRLDLRASGHGESRLYGVVLERDGPGVVYDSLGIVGARAARMLGFDPAHLRGQLSARGTDLVVIAFGGNDADDERSEEDFLATFREVARLVRTARPEASCLLAAPLDQGERDERGRVRTLAPVERIVRAMRQAAREEGCAFFDTFTAMGGAGSMGRWARRGLASSDYRHATPAGYRIIGQLFYQALLRSFAEWLAAGEPPPEPRSPTPNPDPDSAPVSAPVSDSAPVSAPDSDSAPVSDSAPAPAPAPDSAPAPPPPPALPFGTLS